MGEWQPIATHPDSPVGEEPSVLVWSAEIGEAQIGRVITYRDGEKLGKASGYHGEWGITHWMPLPSGPK